MIQWNKLIIWIVFNVKQKIISQVYIFFIFQLIFRMKKFVFGLQFKKVSRRRFSKVLNLSIFWFLMSFWKLSLKTMGRNRLEKILSVDWGHKDRFLRYIFNLLKWLVQQAQSVKNFCSILDLGHPRGPYQK